MPEFIEANLDTLFTHAHSRAESYLRAAETQIDAVFGDGYAREHPELIAAFMKTASDEFTRITTAKVLQNIGYALDSIASAMKTPD
ncbi:Uncharacterised protein [Achromobacter denitrificans]|uniref:hypothetical protein n=1 Tax=Achromobacter denitrificans TaxID=32002 RepID=UPI000786D5ED|nr:hypothetical protein [Achromobacter denitrificans]OLU06524.1 hypothetical protein BVK87_19870 [Achromobacter denitrificans]QKH40364.1 hypothetical protein FOC82_02330 [Achromobacter denitrificans]QKH52491.1 hypothetical protein FOC80_24820 [Achromobacter denitrificans]CAB3710338.1 hypothetical protein LMG1231_03108 [Achromobacter denitrificans]SUW33285.1 Uncharacterised protein [Achromobacter denitrificans]